MLVRMLSKLVGLFFFSGKNDNEYDEYDADWDWEYDWENTSK